MPKIFPGLKRKQVHGLRPWGPWVCGAVVSLKQRSHVHHISQWPEEGHLSIQSTPHPNLLYRPETNPGLSHRRDVARAGLSVGSLTLLPWLDVYENEVLILCLLP